MEQTLRARSAGPAARLGAVAFIHRFGSALNPHLHFHGVVLDGVLASAPAGAVVFHPATGIETEAIAAVQATVRCRLLASFVRRGRLERDDAHNMAQWPHGGGFSVARPPFALDRLRAFDPERLVYDGAKPGPGADTLAAPAPDFVFDQRIAW